MDITPYNDIKIQLERRKRKKTYPRHLFHRMDAISCLIVLAEID